MPVPRFYTLWAINAPLDERRLGGHGITDFVVHLWQYRLNSHAIRDWPASIPNHIGWAQAFPQLLAQVKPRMQTAADDAGVDRANTLLVSPHRAVMAAFEPSELLAMNIHDAGTYADTQAGRINDRFMRTVADLQRQGVAYHIADERTFEGGTIAGDRLRIGGCAYRSVIPPADPMLNPHGQDLVKRLRAAGIIAAQLSVDAHPPPKLADTAIPGTSIPIGWQVMEPASNECPLQPIGTGSDGSYSAAFVTASGVSNLSLAFADHIANVTLNGQALAATATDEGTVVLIPNEVWVIGENLLIVRSEFRIGDPQARPLAWIRGRFAVRSSAPFVAGSNDTVATAGPFVLGPPPIGVPTDLTVAGYPFVRSPIRARGTLDLVAATSILKFNESAAAAVRIEIDGTDCGFAWAPDWSLKMATPLSAGKHVLEVTVFPSTYNVFGPQHHVDGDVHVVSPAQFEGTKNFADRPLAPPQTRVSAWHVKPLKLPSSIVSCDARAREP